MLNCERLNSEAEGGEKRFMNDHETLREIFRSCSLCIDLPLSLAASGLAHTC